VRLTAAARWRTSVAEPGDNCLLWAPTSTARSSADRSPACRRPAPVIPPYFGMTWDEIEAVNWDQPAPRPDGRLRQYTRDAGGAWQYAGKGETSQSLAAQLARTAASSADGTWPAGTGGLSGTGCIGPRCSPAKTRSAPAATGTAFGLSCPR
jgi:hypothetical protein